jgi:branched-chain amino acid transport system permease protein
MMSPIKSAYRRSLWGIAALAAVLAVFGVSLDNAFYLTTLTLSMIFAIAALGMSLLLGMAGQASLGQAAFFGIGAYTAANLAERLGVEPVLAIFAGAMLAGLVGWVIARPLLRLSGDYLAMASLAFGIVMYIFFGQVSSLTGGFDPGFSVRGFSLFGIALGDVRSMYWVSALVLLLAVWIAINLAHSRYGRALRALKTSEAAAEGVGIPTSAFKTMVFAIAAALAGLAGGLYLFSLRSINATDFGFSLSVELLIIVIVGRSGARCSARCW